MGNICCEEPPTNSNNAQVKSLLSHKDPITVEQPDLSAQYSQEKIQEAIRHSVAVRDDKKYTLSDFEKVSVLGKGGFAIVYLVQLKENKQKGIDIKYAMKEVGKKKLMERRFMDNLLIEKTVLADMKSPFMIQLSLAFQDKKNCYFVMEYAGGGDVYSLIHNPDHPGKVSEYKKLGEVGARFILATVILAFETLHSGNIMYRDLKPENVLIFDNGYTKLADFGLAKKSDDDDLAKTLAGTKIYFAPEVVEKQGNTKYYSGHNKTVDFWTLGVFLHQLILFVPPFDHNLIVKGKFIKKCYETQQKREFRGEISEEAKDMINKFLKVDPKKRLGANGYDQIKNHAFFNGFDWQKLQKLEMESPLKPIVKKYPAQTVKLKDVQLDNEINQSYDKIDGITYKAVAKY